MGDNLNKSKGCGFLYGYECNTLRWIIFLENWKKFYVNIICVVSVEECEQQATACGCHSWTAVDYWWLTLPHDLDSASVHVITIISLCLGALTQNYIHLSDLISAFMCSWLVYSDPGFDGLLEVLVEGEYPHPQSWGFPEPFIGSLRPLRMVKCITYL